MQDSYMYHHWFDKLFGFSEKTGSYENYCHTAKQFEVIPDPEREGHLFLKSKANEKVYRIGKFTRPSLKEYREKYGPMLK